MLKMITFDRSPGSEKKHSLLVLLVGGENESRGRCDVVDV